MIVLMKGNGEQRQDWHTDERVAAGYSRVYLIERGKVFYRDGEGERMLLPGKLYLLPSCTPFVSWHDPADPLCCLWFHMDFFPLRLSQLVEADETFPLLKEFCELLHRLFETEQQDTSYASEVMKAFGEYLQASLLPDQRYAMEEEVAYIRAHYQEGNLSVGRISEHFGYTPEHFIRRFSAAVGMTPYQYLLNLRMYEARRLLLEKHSIQETARAVGYDNPRAFSSAFQKRHAMTPGEFRKNAGRFA